MKLLFLLLAICGISLAGSAQITVTVTPAEADSISLGLSKLPVGAARDRFATKFENRNKGQNWHTIDVNHDEGEMMYAAVHKLYPAPFRRYLLHKLFDQITSQPTKQ